MKRFVSSRKGFTLLEVLVALAIVGLVVVGGFRLAAMSLRTLGEMRAERELVSQAQKLHLAFLADKEMADKGEKDGVKWTLTMESVPVFGDMELTLRKLVVEYQGREMVLFLPES